MARIKPAVKKDPDAVKLGKLGGKARAKVLSADRRKEIATLAAKARWHKSSISTLLEVHEAGFAETIQILRVGDPKSR